jgi:hypothetical protein
MDDPTRHLDSRAQPLGQALQRFGVHVVARVSENGGATDLAVRLLSTRLGVLRMVNEATSEDHGALATMMTQGDFVWAGLVYSEREGSETVGLIETFHVSEQERLVSRLLELRSVLAGSVAFGSGP